MAQPLNLLSCIGMCALAPGLVPARCPGAQCSLLLCWRRCSVMHHAGFAGDVSDGLLLHPDGHTLIYPLVSVIRLLLLCARRSCPSATSATSAADAELLHAQGSTIVLRDKQDSSAQEFLQVRRHCSAQALWRHSYSYRSCMQAKSSILRHTLTLSINYSCRATPAGSHAWPCHHQVACWRQGS
jgi:hypothetical protein